MTVLKQYLKMIPVLFVVMGVWRPSSLPAEETIQWAVMDWPPFYFLDGENKGKGISETILKFYQSKLTKYNHEEIKMRLARYIRQAEDKKDICMYGLLKTPEREKDLYYSYATAFGVTQRIIMKTSTWKKLGQPETMSLEALLLKPDMSVIFQQKRAYGVLNHIINKYQHSENVNIGAQSGFQLIKMLLLDRIDYIVEYPYPVAMVSKKNKKLDLITSVRIEELPPYILSYCTCAKTPNGKKVIERINEIIRQYRASEEYWQTLSAGMNWMDKKSARYLKKLYKDMFLPMKEWEESPNSHGYTD